MTNMTLMLMRVCFDIMFYVYIAQGSISGGYSFASNLPVLCVLQEWFANRLQQMADSLAETSEKQGPDQVSDLLPAVSFGTGEAREVYRDVLN